MGIAKGAEAKFAAVERHLVSLKLMHKVERKQLVLCQ